jgi:hypothetical protein
LWCGACRDQDDGESTRRRDHRALRERITSSS